MRKVRLVGSAVFWSIDYVLPSKTKPPIFEQVLLSIYRTLENFVLSKSDVVWYASGGLLRKHYIKDRMDSSRHVVVPFGIRTRSSVVVKKGNVIGYLGSLLRNRVSLEVLVEAMQPILTDFHNLSVDIVGSGPDEKYFRDYVNSNGVATRFNFRGNMYGPELERIMSGWKAGLCLYDYSGESDQTDSGYGVSSKVIEYLDRGVPVIVTDSPGISKEIRDSDAGVVIRKRFEPRDVEQALRLVLGNPALFSAGISEMARKYNYESVYGDALLRVLEVIKSHRGKSP